MILVGGHPHWTAELQGGRQNKPQEHHGCVKYHCALWEDGHPCSMARRRFNKGENGNVIAGAADNDNKQRDVGILPDKPIPTNSLQAGNAYQLLRNPYGDSYVT